MSEEPTIKIHGARRSSTTLTERALDHNFNANIKSGPTPHKHGTLVEVPSIHEVFEGFVVCVKNPYAYVASMLEWTRTHNLEETQAGLQAIVWQLLGNWGAKNQNYVDFKNRHKSKVKFVKAENWVDRPVEVLKDVQAFFGLEWARETEDGEPKAWTTEEHPSPLPGRGADSYDPDYYLQAKYIAELGESLTRKIEERLNDRVWLQHVMMEIGGYSLSPPGWDDWGDDA